MYVYVYFMLHHRFFVVFFFALSVRGNYLYAYLFRKVSGGISGTLTLFYLI